MLWHAVCVCFYCSRVQEKHILCSIGIANCNCPSTKSLSGCNYNCADREKSIEWYFSGCFYAVRVAPPAFCLWPSIFLLQLQTLSSNYLKKSSQKDSIYPFGYQLNWHVSFPSVLSNVPCNIISRTRGLDFSVSCLIIGDQECLMCTIRGWMCILVVWSLILFCFVFLPCYLRSKETKHTHPRWRWEAKRKIPSY